MGAGVLDVAAAARRLSRPQRLALRCSYAERSLGDLPEPLTTFWAAVAVLLADVDVELHGERVEMLAAADAAVRAAEVAELGAVFLDAHGDPVDPFG